MEKNKINPVKITGPDKLFFGVRKSDATRIYIDKPSFDCEWYWSFGYLGNKDEHYHLNGYQNGRNTDIHSALSSDYDLNPSIEKNLWVFCELALSIYKLKESAELFHLGGAHMTTNPHRKSLKKISYERTINEKLLPEQLQTFWNLIKGEN